MKTILIVDDEKRIRTTYTKAFLREGFRPIEADSAEEAYSILEKGGVDLVLLDIKMPEVDGTVLHDITQMFYKKVKVIVSSVYPVEEQKRLIGGVCDYYDKAEGVKALVNKVRKALLN